MYPVYLVYLVYPVFLTGTLPGTGGRGREQRMGSPLPANLRKEQQGGNGEWGDERFVNTRRKRAER